MNNHIYSNLFLDNKYTRTYYRIISKAISENRKRKQGIYYERHHIVPKSMGGSDDRTNLVFLTAREHFIVHALLWRMTIGSDKFKMAHAWNMLRGGRKWQKRYFNARLYEVSKVERTYSSESKVRMSIGKLGTLNGFYNKSHTQYSKDLMGEKRKGGKNPAAKWFFGISPTGDVVIDSSITTFAREHNLRTQSCRRRAQGKWYTVSDGWFFRYITPEKEFLLNR